MKALDSLIKSCEESAFNLLGLPNFVFKNSANILLFYSIGIILIFGGYFWLFINIT
jgi:hypothetical protein